MYMKLTHTHARTHTHTHTHSLSLSLSKVADTCTHHASLTWIDEAGRGGGGEEAGHYSIESSAPLATSHEIHNTIT